MKSNSLDQNFGRAVFFAIALMASISAMAQDNDDDTEPTSVYEVPVNDRPELVPYAHFAMYSDVRYKDGKWEFCYKLPVELTSDRADIPQIAFVTTEKVNETTYKVAGKHSSGTCTFGEKPSCHLFYKDLNLNADDTKTFLSKKYSGSELEMRGMVASRFAKDPEGILLFSLPSK